MDPASQSAASLELGDAGLDEEEYETRPDNGAETRPLVRGADPDEEVYPTSAGGRYSTRPLPPRGRPHPDRSSSAARGPPEGAASVSTAPSGLDALSNESILAAATGFGNGIARVLFAARSSAGTAAETPGGVPAPSSGGRNRGGEASPQRTDPSDGSKKRLLLLMGTLTVALLGAVLAKDSALLYEEGVEGGEVSGVFHNFRRQGPKGAEESQGATGGKPVQRNVPDVSGYLPKGEVNATDYILPGTESAPPLSAARGRPYTPVLNHFQFRDPDGPYAGRWGRFDLEDPDPEWRGKMRPQADFSKAPNRDVDNGDFPEGSWQSDEAYMAAFLAEAKRLVNRSIEAVYGEYGVGLPEDGSVELDDEWSGYRDLFAPFTVKDGVNDPLPQGGGWTTRRSADDIARRHIHHVMTGDTFKLVLGGHSAAAGHGAGFNQSHVIEAGHVLEPVFAHLGVEFRAYNFAQGGMGTAQQALAGMDLRGKETDWIMWDSSMTEKPAFFNNFFMRQALIAGNRAPVIMADGIQDAQHFHDVAGASVAGAGQGWTPMTTSDEQAKTVPWAAQYLVCGREMGGTCKAHEYTAGCWVDRKDYDGYEPAVPQGAIVGGQAAWHPGNRVHKRKGRMTALVVLRTLQYALDRWEEFGREDGFPIKEERWHVTDYYESVREKAKDVPGCWGGWKIGQKRMLHEVEGGHEGKADDGGPGRDLLEDDELGLGGDWPARLCNIPMQGRTLWGPRHNPMETSLLSIMRPNRYGERDPAPTNGYMDGPCYQPPDLAYRASWVVPPSFLDGVENPEAQAPLIGYSRRLDGEGGGQVSGPPSLRGEASSDAVARRGGDGRRSLREEQVDAVHPRPLDVPRGESPLPTGAADDGTTGRRLDAIEPGLGLGVKWGRTGVCDGSSHHWCDKKCDSNCLMGGAQDNRGMVCFDGTSGWLVFDVKGVKHGFIGGRMEPWHKPNEIPEMGITNGWTEENNGGDGNYGKSGGARRLVEERSRRAVREGVERMEEEIARDIEAEGDISRRRLGGGQSCGLTGNDYTFEFAINGSVVTWDKAKFCEHFTRLNYNLDVIKFMDDPDKTGDFEVAMRMAGNTKEVMCISHLYWA